MNYFGSDDYSKKLKIQLLISPIVSAFAFLPSLASAEVHVNNAEPILIASQELRNTCENETESYYDPFQGRVATRTNLICRPRLVPRNSDQECQRTTIYQPNPTTGQIGSELGQDCINRTPSGSSSPQSDSNRTACQQIANNIRQGRIPSNILRRMTRTYRQTCT